MTRIHRLRSYAVIAAATVALAACASKMQPAQQMISKIEAVVAAAQPEAAKYVPDQLKDVQDKVANLKTAFAQQDYGAVITAAPSVLASAQGLAAAAAQKKSVVMGELNEQWSRISANLPANVAAIQKRIEVLSHNARLRKGIDLAAAKKGLDDVNTAWTTAQSDFTSGHLGQAVTAAKGVQTQLQSLAQSIKFQLPQPGDASGSSAASTN
jgi:hypothetical protein